MSDRKEREFVDVPAVRAAVPLLVGMTGPSGSGKTFSSLRLASGIQQVVGGEIFGIDTEANRMLHYADKFKFRHVVFKSPFDPLAYLDALKYCVNKGAKTVIIDSTSHMHEGVGGTLDTHDAECERLASLYKKSREAVQMLAWAKPKQELRSFLNEMLQLHINIIFCFRAKEKIKIVPGQQPKALGFQPVANDELIYEMTLNVLLYPNSGGIPTWQPEEMGERAIIKLPEQFKSVFKDKKPLDESIGVELAKWSSGSSAKKPEPAPVITPKLQEPIKINTELDEIANSGFDDGFSLELDKPSDARSPYFKIIDDIIFSPAHAKAVGQKGMERINAILGPERSSQTIASLRQIIDWANGKFSTLMLDTFEMPQNNY